MSDEQIEELAKTVPRVEMCEFVLIRRRKKLGVVYVSFCFHNISRIPGTKMW